MKTFKELNLKPEIIQSLDELKFVEPSAIQAQAIPFLLENKGDLIALAQTGTGKTAAFSLPILNQIDNQKNELTAIILCPTRELCLQISADMKKFSQHLKNLSVTAVYGGERIDIQMRALRQGTNIVVGTPGRVHDLIRRKVLNLKDIKWLVLDEADEMLDMGFKDDLDNILGQTSSQRQTLLFSATMSKNVYSIAQNYMKNPKEISVGPKNIGAENVSHEYYIVQSEDRFEALRRILDSLANVYGILFCRTKNETQTIADRLKQLDYNAEAIHGDIAQSNRTKIMDKFKHKHIHLLVATDVAARGIDVDNLSHVINYSLPDQAKVYTHRSGRTGRAQNSGIAVSLVRPNEVGFISRIEKMIGKSFVRKQIPSGQEVYDQQINNLAQNISNLDIKDLEKQEHFNKALAALQKFKKEELIAYLVQSSASKLTDNYQDSRDLNAKGRNYSEGASPKEHVVFTINIGKKQLIDTKGFFGLINSSHNLNGVEIGNINLQADSTIFSVEKRRAKDISKALTNKNFKGKKITVKESSENVFYTKPDFKPRRNDKFSKDYRKGSPNRKRTYKKYR